MDGVFGASACAPTAKHQGRHHRAILSKDRPPRLVPGVCRNAYFIRTSPVSPRSLGGLPVTAALAIA